MTLQIETLADDTNLCGEAPTWDAGKDRVLWVDAEKSLVYQLSMTDGRKSIISRDLAVSGMALNHTGELILSGTCGMHLWRGNDNW